MYRREFFIEGAWIPPAGGDRLGVISPSTEEVVGEVPAATPADIDRAVSAARSAFDDGPWPRMTPGERADVLCAGHPGVLEDRAGAGGRVHRGDQARARGPAEQLHPG
jgi:acyl-CoA reductase-like NAD-dependent aldehyde dehydrogenase